MNQGLSIVEPTLSKSFLAGRGIYKEVGNQGVRQKLVKRLNRLKRIRVSNPI